ncbi:MAG: DUF2971 domain-containing protein [Nitrospiraceae bacterium]
MLVYHFINAIYGLEALNRRLKIARIAELNDPFELLAVDLSDHEFRKAVEETKAELSKTTGLLCFCKTWKHTTLWAHYADKHKGICLGFEVPDTLLKNVTYVDHMVLKPSVPDEIFMKRLLFTKSRHWEHEQEYRVYIEIDEQIDGQYYINFSDELSLKCVIVGNQSNIRRSQISQALGNLNEEVEVFKASPGFNTFELVRNTNEAMWA